jgi:hypothetical protein
MFSWDTTEVNRISETFSTGYMIPIAAVVDKYLSAASIAASDSNLLVGESVGGSTLL